MAKFEPVLPLFKTTAHATSINEIAFALNTDDYNKKVKGALINAENDNQAIQSFLNEYKDSPTTIRSYAKEVERLLLWCIYIGQINISSIKRDHLMEYQHFLKSPTPKEQWCGPCVPRFQKDGTVNANWRPFVKGLSASSINKAIKILDSFFNYLVQANYLSGNPLAIDRRRKKRNRSKSKIVDRYLELRELHAVFDALNQQNNGKDPYQTIRARYIILLLFFTGMRISEAADHRMGHFIQRNDHWFLRVTGKGKKLREIPIPDELLDALINFRIQSGLPSSYPKFREKTPLIPMQNLKNPISARRIDQILRWAFELGAARLKATEPQRASKLRQASAHWLRHSYVTHLLESGASLKVAQENAGHSDIGTTMHYYHIAQTDRHSATQSLSLSIESKRDSTS